MIAHEPPRAFCPVLTTTHPAGKQAATPHPIPVYTWKKVLSSVGAFARAVFARSDLFGVIYGPAAISVFFGITTMTFVDHARCP